jgi:hypothetical protein
MKVSIIAAVVTLGLSSAAWAQEEAASEQEELSKDMEEAHQKVLSSPPAQQMSAPVAESRADSPSRSDDGPTRREGFTFELGLGVHYTSEYLDSDRRVGGAFGGSIGWFLNDNTALLLRFVGSSITDNDNLVVFADGQNRDATRFHGLSTYFVGPQIQFFPHDRIMLAAGLGLGGTLESVRISVDHTDEGDSHHNHGEAGLGASLRAGFTVYQRKDIAALRIGLEAVPTYINSDWHITTGLVGELQVF